ncbi:MAG TPA: class II histone deacetylase [Virgibacillus sp.]|nr:class II histone deacetylase [Virgibacillus sp.]HLR65571.1 class II histone deacetylase [Virgibacillus sp.]
MNTAFIWDDNFRKDHKTGNQQLDFSENSISTDIEFENPRRAGLVFDVLQQTKIIKNMKQFSPLEATIKDLRRVHSEHMVQKVIKANNSPKLTEVGPSAFAASGSYETAKLAAGGAMKAVDVLFTEKHINRSYACIRPPGHHATRNESLGFCLFNNVAIAAEYSREKYGVKKILIIDWDVHHGNGTQDIFYHDHNTCFISIHQEFNYPTTGGALSETGSESGEGYNINIPLPPGCGDEEYISVLNNIVKPVGEAFNPDLILLSAGQDPNLYDPLGRMMVTREGFRQMARTVRQMADQICEGKLAVIQEGGYSLSYHPIATLGLVEGLVDCVFSQTFTIEQDHPLNHYPIPIDRLIERIKYNVPLIS